MSAVETNGIDNEDSINLTIGEDEENLLGEEVYMKLETLNSKLQKVFYIDFKE